MCASATARHGRAAVRRSDGLSSVRARARRPGGAAGRYYGKPPRGGAASGKPPRGGGKVGSSAAPRLLQRRFSVDVFDYVFGVFGGPGARPAGWRDCEWRAGPGGGTLPLPPAAASPLPPPPGGLSPAAAELPPSFGGLPPGALRLRTRTVTDSDRHGPDCRTTRTDWLGPCGVCGRHRRRDAGCGLGRTPGTDHNLSFISNRQRQKKGILYALWTRTPRPPAACP
jgi:hypothetical protein